MSNLNCIYCGLKCSNFKILEKHQNSCKSNPKFNFSEEPKIFKENIIYHPDQKIQYICEKCGKVIICRYHNYQPICSNCRGSDSRKKTFKDFDWSERNRKSKQTCLKKYGVENPNQLKEVKQKIKDTIAKDDQFYEKRNNKTKKVWLEKYGTETPQNLKSVLEKSKQTQFKKYGNWYTETAEYKEKYRKTCLEKYGVDSHNKALLCKEKSKQTCLEHYGVDNFGKSEKILQFRRAQFLYEDIAFDSKPELAFWIYCRDQGLNIKRNLKSFPYIFKEKEYQYFPDFEIDGKYYEIKGNQFLTENGEWQNPFDHNQDSKYEAKHQCALKNNVTILYEKDYQRYIDYVNQKYTKDYLNLFNLNITFPYQNENLDDKTDLGLIKHFHKSIYKAFKFGKLSPFKAWQNKNLIKQVALNRLHYVGKCEPKDIIFGFSTTRIAPRISIFSPKKAEQLIKKYLSDCQTIVDPFSGFSGRLLGACRSKKIYIGKDLNKKHVDESNEIIKYKNLQNCSVTVEDILKKEKTETYDALFTCPPYEDKENWNGENDICKTCDEWIDICMQKYKCKKYLFVVDKTEKYNNYIVDKINVKNNMFKTKGELVIFLNQNEITKKDKYYNSSTC